MTYHHGLKDWNVLGFVPQGASICCQADRGAGSRPCPSPRGLAAWHRLEPGWSLLAGRGGTQAVPASVSTAPGYHGAEQPLQPLIPQAGALQMGRQRAGGCLPRADGLLAATSPNRSRNPRVSGCSHTSVTQTKQLTAEEVNVLIRKAKMQ